MDLSRRSLFGTLAALFGVAAVGAAASEEPPRFTAGRTPDDGAAVIHKGENVLNTRAVKSVKGGLHDIYVNDRLLMQIVGRSRR